MNFGSSFSRNEVVDPFGGSRVRNERIVVFSDGDASIPSTSSSTPSKVTLPQFFAKSEPTTSKTPSKKDVKTSPTTVTDEDKLTRSQIDIAVSARRLDPPGAIADEKLKKHRKTSKRTHKSTSSSKEGSGRRHKEESRKKKEGRRKQQPVMTCSDETTVSWTRTPTAVPGGFYTTPEDFHRSRRLSNDGQLLRLKASKSKRNLTQNFEASHLDMTSTTTKTTSSDVSEITEIVRRIQANPKSSNPRRIRNDRRSHKRGASRGLERKTSSTRLTMVASPSKARTTAAIHRKNSLTCASLVEPPDSTLVDSPVKPRKTMTRRSSVAPLDFSEFENEDFSDGDGVGLVEVTAN